MRSDFVVRGANRRRERKLGRYAGGSSVISILVQNYMFRFFVLIFPGSQNRNQPKIQSAKRTD